MLTCSAAAPLYICRKSATKTFTNKTFASADEPLHCNKATPDATLQAPYKYVYLKMFVKAALVHLMMNEPVIQERQAASLHLCSSPITQFASCCCVSST